MDDTMKYSEMPNSSDLIYRQAAIDAIERNAYRHTYIDQIVDIIKELPSAQPEQPIRCGDCKKHNITVGDFKEVDCKLMKRNKGEQNDFK